MSIPGNAAPVVEYVTVHKTRIDNDTILKLAGGSNAKWGEYLKGPRAQAMVYAANTLLKDHGYKIVSKFRGAGQWECVTRHEAHLREAEFNLQRIDGDYKRAHLHIMAIAEDTAAPDYLQLNCMAWLELFDEPLTNHSLSIMHSFALELVEKTASKHTTLLLGSSDRNRA